MAEMSAHQPYSLAIETTGRVGSVAIGTGDKILAAETFRTTLNHAMELLPTIDRLCRAHDCKPAMVGELYVSGGPGSFTGIRVGITFARSMAWSTQCRVVRVPTLEVVAQNALEAEAPPACVGVVLDAKRCSVFAATFERRESVYVAVDEAAERDPASFLATLPSGAAVMGEGVGYIPDALAQSDVSALPEELYRARAEVVYQLGRKRALDGRFIEVGSLVPIYVRRPEAEEVWERRHGASASEV